MRTQGIIVALYFVVILVGKPVVILMRIKFLSLLFFVILGTVELAAQRTHSFSIGGGISYYYGDLTDKFNNVFVRPAVTASYSYYFQPNLRFRLGVAHSTVGAADSLANDPARVDRNLHFRSPITEGSATVVYEFLRDKRFGISWISKPHISPYVFGGVAMFNFKPQAQYEGQWYDLQPLGTEGQFIEGGDYPEPYSRLQVSLPVGAGITVRFMDYIGASFEIGHRTTLTDYIDDVSTNYPDLGQLAESSGTVAAALSNRAGTLNSGIGKRGNPGANDSYTFFSFMLTYYLDRYANRR